MPSNQEDQKNNNKAKDGYFGDFANQYKKIYDSIELTENEGFKYKFKKPLKNSHGQSITEISFPKNCTAGQVEYLFQGQDPSNYNPITQTIKIVALMIPSISESEIRNQMSVTDTNMITMLSVFFSTDTD